MAKIRSDYSIEIPKDIIKKFGWKVGTEVWIDIHDEDFQQIIIGKKFRGKEATESMNKLREKLST